MIASYRVALIRLIQPRYLKARKEADRDVGSKYVRCNVNIDKEARWLYSCYKTDYRAICDNSPAV
jgi:hypothetical protein